MFPQIHVHVKPGNGIFFGKRAFADVIKDRVGPKSFMTGLLIRTETLDTEMQTQGDRSRDWGMVFKANSAKDC